MTVPRDRKGEFKPELLKKNHISVSQDITEIQNCIIHKLRSSSKYVSHKDLKALMADLKTVYAVVDKASALEALDASQTAGTKNTPRFRSHGGKTGPISALTSSTRKRYVG